MFWIGALLFIGIIFMIIWDLFEPSNNNFYDDIP